MWPDEDDALAWQEREYDAADREREAEDQARHEPPPQPTGGTTMKRYGVDRLIGDETEIQVGDWIVRKIGGLWTLGTKSFRHLRDAVAYARFAREPR